MKQYSFKLFTLCLLSTTLTHAAAERREDTAFIDISALNASKVLEQDGFWLHNGLKTIATTLRGGTQILCDRSNPNTVHFSATQPTGDYTFTETLTNPRLLYCHENAETTFTTMPFTTINSNPGQSATTTTEESFDVPMRTEFETAPQVRMQPFYPEQHTLPSKTLVVFGWPRKTNTAANAKLFEAFLIHNATQKNAAPWIQRLVGRTALHENITGHAHQLIQECTAPQETTADSKQ